MAKDKEVIQVDTDISLTSIGKSEINVLARDFVPNWPQEFKQG